MHYLSHYIEQMNQRKSVFGEAPILHPLSQKALDEVVLDITMALEPERIHCDGEASQQEVVDKYTYYTAVCSELIDCALSQGLRVPSFDL